jgi:Domain of unknown function (DUF1707)
MSTFDDWTAGVGDDPDVRASDADRDAVAELLQEHHAAGRIDTRELQERVDRCYQTKTVAELEQLLTDLPRRSGPEPHGPPRWRHRMMPLVPIVLALAAICAITGRHAVWLALPVALITWRAAGSHYGAGSSWGRYGAGHGGGH